MCSELLPLRDDIIRTFVNYEYLAGSICDGTVTTKSANFSSIYEQVSTMEKALQKDFHTFEVYLKKFISLLVESGSRLEKVKQNFQTNMVNFLQDYLPKFRKTEKQITLIEKSTVNNLYIIVCRMCTENGRNPSFWKRFGGLYKQLGQIVQQDLMDALVATSEKWDPHKKLIDEMVNSWESHFPAVISANAALEMEGTLIRKNIAALQDSLKKLESKLGSEELTSRQAVAALIGRLEGAYYPETQFTTEVSSKEENPLALQQKDAFLKSLQENKVDDWVMISK